MKCPYCNKSIHFEEYGSQVYQNEDERQLETSDSDGYEVAHGFCPACGDLIALYREGTYVKGEYSSHLDDLTLNKIIYPASYSRPVEPEVPESYKTDYKEATSVLNLSPKASAAISRRLLQNVLREEFKIKKHSLAKEIEEFISLKDVPSFLSEAVDAVRNIGNFAAHPLKDTNTGEIVEVEEGEAEWLLDVIDALFDFTFVQPKRLEKRKKELDKKLSNLGKPPMKK